MATKKEKNEERLPLSGELLEKLLSSDGFSYAVNGDELYRKYRDGYLEGGRLAMKDAVGQAAALTGGYGNSYAVTAGQQAYDAYAAKAADRIPELYRLALERYERGRKDLTENYGLLADREAAAAAAERQERLDRESADRAERELALKTAAQKLAERKEDDERDYRAGTLRAKEREDYYDYLLGAAKQKAAEDPLASLDYAKLGVRGVADLDSLVKKIRADAKRAKSADGANARVAKWIGERRESGAVNADQAELLWFFMRFYESDFE